MSSLRQFMFGVLTTKNTEFLSPYRWYSYECKLLSSSQMAHSPSAPGEVKHHPMGSHLSSSEQYQAVGDFYLSGFIFSYMLAHNADVIILGATMTFSFPFQTR
ncbi:hypothetical protein XELAEV_18024066mg [Xenopus laevis]|uniref:Uncharacterized protein n=1 Tax=Xenopus laevis TaxID=8355 RepID=A0A974D651_XENLA|nr:hypothetical protein XELAEV_18024066mg [Xenopus laevis]